MGRCDRQNILRPYLKIWDWDLIFGRAVKAISSPGVEFLTFRRPWHMFTLEKAEIIYANIQANLTNLFADEKYSHSNAPIASVK